MAIGALNSHLDQINSFLNPPPVWVSCPTKITTPNNSSALEGEAEVADFTGTLAITVIPPESQHEVRGSAFRSGDFDPVRSDPADIWSKPSATTSFFPASDQYNPE